MVQYQGYTKSSIPTLCFHIENPAVYWILKIRFFSFRHNFTKKYVFSKVRLIPDSARSDLSKEPIKSGYLCKSAKIIRFAVKTCPNRQVAYTDGFYSTSILVHIIGYQFKTEKSLYNISTRKGGLF